VNQRTIIIAISLAVGIVFSMATLSFVSEPAAAKPSVTRPLLADNSDLTRLFEQDRTEHGPVGSTDPDKGRDAKRAGHETNRSAFDNLTPPIRLADLARDDHLAAERLNVGDRASGVLAVCDYHQLLTGTDQFLGQSHRGGVCADYDDVLTGRVLGGPRLSHG